MNTQNTTVTATSVNRPFALICSYQVPTTELDPDFVPSVSVCIGSYETKEQAKQARQAIQHPALISAWCYYKFEDDCTATANNGGVQ
jgi:hypothetical protein